MFLKPYPNRDNLLQNKLILILILIDIKQEGKTGKLKTTVV